MLCDDLDGWDGACGVGVEGGPRGRGPCILVAGSLCCTAEINAAL